MAITFQLRSTALNAYSALGSATHTKIYDAVGGATAPAVTADGTSGAFGNIITCDHATLIRGLKFPAANSFPASGPVSIRVRFIPRFTTTPAVSTILWSADSIAAWDSNVSWMYVHTDGKVIFALKDIYGKTYVNVSSSAAGSFTSGTPTEICCVYDNTATAGTVKIFQDGVQLGTGQNPSNGSRSWDIGTVDNISWGFSSRFKVSRIDLIECLIYDTALTAYSPGSTYQTATAFDGGTNTFPADSDVRNGTAFTVAGVAHTGSMASGGGAFPFVG